jgi:hypothetical protein
MQNSDLDDEELVAGIDAARQAAADRSDLEAQHDLAVLLLESYERHGSADAVAEALGVLRQAITASSGAGTDWNGLHGILGAVLICRYEVDGDSAVACRWPRGADRAG